MRIVRTACYCTPSGPQIMAIDSLQLLNIATDCSGPLTPVRRNAYPRYRGHHQGGGIHQYIATNTTRRVRRSSYVASTRGGWRGTVGRHDLREHDPHRAESERRHIIQHAIRRRVWVGWWGYSAYEFCALVRLANDREGRLAAQERPYNWING